MADKKIINLNALVTQATTDLYETSANGSGSFKETRAQMLAYMQNNITFPPNAAGIRVCFDSVYGIDAAGRGAEGDPFKTLAYGYSQITDAAFNKQYLFDCVGDFTLTDFGFPPNISYDFNGGSLTVVNQAYPDSGWDGAQGVVSIKNCGKLTFQNGIYMGFNDAGRIPQFAFIRFDNVICDDASTYYFEANLNNPCILVINGMFGISNIPSLIVKDWYGGISNTTITNYLHQHLAPSNGGNFTLRGLEALGTFEVQNYSGGGLLFNMYGCALTDPKFNGQGPGTLQARGYGNNFDGNVQLQVAPGHPEYLLFKADILQADPILIGGATYTPSSIADSIDANVTETNYQSLGPSVKQKLDGINDALAHPYQRIKLINANTNITQDMVGYSNVSNNTDEYNISFELGSLISSDAELEVVSGEFFSVNLIVPNGVTVAGQTNTTINIPPGNNSVLIRRIYTDQYILFYNSILPASGYFQVFNQLSEIATNPNDARGNLGLPSNMVTLDQDQDYVLTNPCPQFIYVDMSVADHTINLPAIQQAGALLNGNPILLKASPQCANQFIRDSFGQNIMQISANDLWGLIPVGFGLSPLTGWWSQKQAGTGAGQDMQETYNEGSTVSMKEGQPIIFSAGSEVIGNASNLMTLYSSSLASTPPTSYVIGMSFTMKQNGYISALGYADPLFSSGTRQVGLWQFINNVSGTLLATANVAKTDPLDTQTGKWRMSAITPVAVSAGARYVVAELNPTTDQWLFYQYSSPYFAVIDGWSQSNFASGTLVYPPINNILGSGQWGNANLQFEPSTGYSSKEETSTLADSIYFKKITTYTQVTQPFGIGTSAQREAINKSLLEDGAMWNDTTSGTTWRFDLNSQEWMNISLGKLFIASTTSNITVGSEHYNLATGLTTYTMPASMKAGQSFAIVGAAGKGVSSSWKLNIGGGQQLYVGNQIANTSVSSTYESDCIVVTCVYDDSKFVASSFVGALSIV